MKELAKLLKEEFDKAHDDPNYEGCKQTGWLLDAFDEAGIQLNAHQNGIHGTYMNAQLKES